MSGSPASSHDALLNFSNNTTNTYKNTVVVAEAYYGQRDTIHTIYMHMWHIDHVILARQWVKQFADKSPMSHTQQY